MRIEPSDDQFLVGEYGLLLAEEPAGQMLNIVFTPDDATNYTAASA